MTPDEIFTAAVDEMIAYNRSAPMTEELAKSIDNAKKREKQSRDDSWSLLNQLDKASMNSPNFAFAKNCVDLLRDKLSGKISKEAFYEGCELLEEAANRT